MELTERIKGIILPVLEEMGLSLVDLSLKKAQGRRVLSVLLDRPGRGVTIDECSSVNKRLGALAEDIEELGDGYLIEVSSPGTDRPLKSKMDFAYKIGKKVIINTREPVDGFIEHIGKVAGVNDEAVVIDMDGISRSISYDVVKKATERVEF